MSGTSSLPENKKSGVMYCKPIDFSAKINEDLKLLPKEDIQHIERHINKPGLLNFMDSVARQKRAFKFSKEKMEKWVEKGKQPDEFPGNIKYPCIDCLRIMKRLDSITFGKDKNYLEEN